MSARPFQKKKKRINVFEGSYIGIAVPWKPMKSSQNIQKLSSFNSIFSQESSP